MGRVLTLVKSNKPSKRVYGIAYKICSKNLAETFENLNLREKCGYSMQQIIFYQNDEKLSPIKCVCYFANENNYYYSPQIDLNSLASQVHQSVGHSGTNKEYLFNACHALKNLAGAKNSHHLRYDSHLFELEKIVKSLE